MKEGGGEEGLEGGLKVKLRWVWGYLQHIELALKVGVSKAPQSAALLEYHPHL